MWIVIIIAMIILMITPMIASQYKDDKTFWNDFKDEVESEKKDDGQRRNSKNK